MSTASNSQSGQDPGPSSGLTLNLASNNPFRNRATSPVTGANNLVSPTSPFDDPTPRPVSRNPFLDPASNRSQPLIATDDMATKPEPAASPSAEEIFDSLTIDDKKPSRPDGAGGKRPMMHSGPPRGGPPGIGHRPTRSQEEAMRARRIHAGSSRPGPSGSPHKRVERRPRRNSESSVADPDKPLTEEEKKAREARRREREKRHREGKDKDKARPPNRKLDIIDQLDATGIYGIGAAFHHDGPFDACNPHRNRKGSRRAPMQAFAKDSLNNSIGGSGPLNKRPDHAQFMGNADPEAFKDYSAGTKIKNGYNFPNQSSGELPVFDPMSRGSILHGDKSLGLGTSTFLEGTPAAKTAIERREAEQAAETADGGGIQRKKSLAQRIRSINRGPREFGPSGRLTNPEGVYSNRRSPDPMPPATTIGTMSGGDGKGEANPFFSEFGNEPETISVKKTGTANPRSPTSPGPAPRRFSGGLERRATAEASIPSPDENKSSGGLLARVKSLKGGRKPRNQTETTSNVPAAPGTAV